MQRVPGVTDCRLCLPGSRGAGREEPGLEGAGLGCLGPGAAGAHTMGLCAWGGLALENSTL